MQLSDLTFRDATFEDSELVTHLINQAYLYEVEWKNQFRTDYNEVSTILKANNDLFYLLLGPEECVYDNFKTNVIGCIRGELDLKNKICQLGMFALWPDMQKKGYGRMLVDYLTSQAKGLGCTKMELYVASPSTHLFPYYEKLQFVRTGRTEVYPIKTIFESAHFEVFEKDI